MIKGLLPGRRGADLFTDELTRPADGENHHDQPSRARVGHVDDVTKVHVVVFNGVKLLDVVAAAESFIEADRAGASHEVEIVSATGEDVATSLGASLAVHQRADSITSTDVLVVPGADDLETVPLPVEAVEAVRHLVPRARRVVGICTGTFLLAEAGVLTGRTVVTHPRASSWLQRSYRDVLVADRVFAVDGPFFTAAGMASSAELVVHLLRLTHGDAVASRVSDALCIPAVRHLDASPHTVRLPPVSAADKWDLLRHDPAALRSVADLARHANLSPRQLHRVLTARSGLAPVAWIRQQRARLAAPLVSQGLPDAEVADRAGYPSVRAFRRRLEDICP